MRRFALAFLIAAFGQVWAASPATAGVTLSSPFQSSVESLVLSRSGVMYGITSTQQSHVVVVQLGTRGQIVASWPVPLPTSKLQRVSADLTIGEEGNAAVAIEYEDDQYVPTGVSYPHEGPECCGHIAISSWRLGHAPPVAHDVSPKVSVDSRQPYWPQIVLAKSEVTAVWIRGNETPYEIGEAEDQLEEAYGKVGRPLHRRSVLQVPGHMRFLDLHLEPDGRPVASWIDDGSILRTDIGSVREGLPVSRRFRALPGKQEAVGFTHDARGHTVFAYVLGKHLMIRASSDGGKFGDAHRVATLPSNAIQPAVRAGGDAVLLVSWIAQYVVGHDEGSSDRFDVELGHIFGDISPPFQLPVATNSEADYEGDATRSFVDSHGRAVLIASRYAHGLVHYEPVLFVAGEDQRFGPPIPFASNLLNCPFELGRTSTEQEIEPNRGGEAIFETLCEENSGRFHQTYFVRFKP
jgi:hypothetical protein